MLIIMLVITLLLGTCTRTMVMLTRLALSILFRVALNTATPLTRLNRGFYLTLPLGGIPTKCPIPQNSTSPTQSRDPPPPQFSDYPNPSAHKRDRRATPKPSHLFMGGLPTTHEDETRLRQ